jgi:hypothetical protein
MHNLAFLLKKVWVPNLIGTQELASEINYKGNMRLQEMNFLSKTIPPFLIVIFQHRSINLTIDKHITC